MHPGHCDCIRGVSFRILYRKPTAKAMTIAQLKEMRPLLNLTELARRSGIVESTLLAKVRRGSELSVVESEALEKALRAVGLEISKVSA